MVNTHGLKMNGLKKAAGETKDLKGYYSGSYIQLSYDLDSGDVITDYFYSLGQNSWKVYHDDSILSVGNVSEPKTMQPLADMIAQKVEEREAWLSLNK